MPRLHFNFRHFFSILAICIFLLSPFLFFTGESFAATGINRTINFQGRLVNNTTGLNVSNGSYSVVFTLYNNPNAGQGTALWSETQNVTTTDGIFRVALGSVTAIPANFNFNWDGLYLGIKVGTDAEMAPRIQMASVPFAFNSQQVAGLTVQDSTGSTGSTSATLKIGSSATNPITVDLGQNGVTFNSGAYNASTSLTIATTNGVATSITLPTSGTLMSLGLNSNQTLASTQVSGNVLTIQDTAGTGTLAGISFNLNGSGTTYDLLGTGSSWSITKAGALTVASCSGCGGASGSNYWNLVNGNGVSNGGYITPINSTADLLIGGQSTSSAAFAVLNLAKNQPIGTHSGNLIVMPNNGWGGQVGINTISPTAFLDVAGTASLGGQLAFRSGFGTIQTTANQALTIGGNTTGNITFSPNNTSTLTLAPNIATFTGTNPVITATGTNTLTLNSGSTGNIQFFSSSYGITNAGALTVASCTGCGGGGGVNYWGLNNGLLYNGNLTVDFAIGGTSSNSAKFLVSQNGTMPTASVSAKTSFAGLVVDQAGVGDIFTASAAGATRFRIAQNGSILMQGQIVTSVGGGGTNTTSGAVTNAIGDQGSLVPNAGFESAISGIGLADGWVPSATNGAIQVISRVATTSAKGVSSIQIKLNASQQTAFYSTCMPIAFQTSLGSYNLSMYAKSTVANKVVVRGYLDTYPSQANCMSDNATGRVISAGTLSAVNLSSTAWATLSQTAITAPASTTNTWAKVHIFVGNPASGTAATVINIDAIRLIENSLTGGVDYAENYPADPSNIPQPGDVVSLDSSDNLAEVTLAKSPMDDSVIGVVSTNPGEVVGSDVPDPKVAVALSGRTPVKVSSENGSIQIGDYLASSDIPGVAVKAITAGPVIGVAMEDYLNSDPASIGSITMFIKNTYYNGASLAANTGLISANGKDIVLPLAAQRFIYHQRC